MKALILLLVLLVPMTAGAAATNKPLDLDATAQAHFTLGVRAYSAGQYEAARAEFQAAYDLSRLPDLLHNLSEVAEKQTKLADAIRLEQDFLDHTLLSDEERQAATTRIAQLRQTLAAAGPSPPLSPASPKPTDAGPQPSASPPSPNTEGGRPLATRRSLAIAGFAVGGGMLAGALATGIVGMVAKSALESRVITLSEFTAGQQAATAYQAVTITLAVAGAGVIVGSIVLATKKADRR